MLRTFLVEDEVVVRETIKKMVPWESHGFELVGEAADGEIALPAICKLKPDLLITDIKMPFMDGLTLCKLVKKELPDIKIVILSGYDDFNYAKQAINIGVEDYLLKPITKNAFVERLEEIRDRYQHEKTQKEYYERFHREIQEYEKNTSRDFFEALVRGDLEMGEIFQWAERLNLDIMAEAYNIMILTLDAGENLFGHNDGYSDWEAAVHSRVESFFLDNQTALLFRNNVSSYAVLIKGQRDAINSVVDNCVNDIATIMENAGYTGEWFLAVGKPVERLSQINQSYYSASRTFAFRYLYDGHVLYYDKFQAEKNNFSKEGDILYLKNVNVNALDPTILQKFLGSGLIDEVDNFVNDYFFAIGQEPMESIVFRNYMILNVRFSVISFLKTLDCDAGTIEEDTEDVLKETNKSIETAMQYAKKLLKKAISIRDENAGNQSRSVLNKAVEFIKANYMDDELSLNKVAHTANVSPTHFSALFSQNMDQTFTEYLTALRMDKAKELLRCTGKRSNEIAAEVGYKDAHYFSYLFKKTQGMTPSEYRKTKEA